jgi:hypothetical protein
MDREREEAEREPDAVKRFSDVKAAAGPLKRYAEFEPLNIEGAQE